MLNEYATRQMFHQCHSLCEDGTFDMIQLGHSTNKVLSHFDNTIVRAISPINGTMMYCVSPRGVKILLDRVGTPSVHVDMVLGMLANVTAFDPKN